MQPARNSQCGRVCHTNKAKYTKKYVRRLRQAATGYRSVVKHGLRAESAVF